MSAVGDKQREGEAHVGVIKALAPLFQPALTHDHVVGHFRFELVGKDLNLTIQALVFPAHEIDLQRA